MRQLSRWRVPVALLETANETPLAAMPVSDHSETWGALLQRGQQQASNKRAQ